MITLRGEGGQAAEYAVIVKNKISGRSAELLLLHILELNNNLCRSMLFAPYVFRAVAAKCKFIGIEFADSAGNMQINLPWHKVFVSAFKAEFFVAPQIPLDTTVSLKIIYTLLACPDTANGTQRTWATAAGVALGSVGGVYQELRAKGQLRVRQSNGRIVREIV